MVKILPDDEFTPLSNHTLPIFQETVKVTPKVVGLDFPPVDWE